MSNSVWPRRGQPTRPLHPWDSPGKSTGVGCHFLLKCMKVKSESEVAQSCLTLRDPMDCSLPGSSTHEIFQARVMEWVAIAFFKEYVKGTQKPTEILNGQRRNNLFNKIKYIVVEDYKSKRPHNFCRSLLSRRYSIISYCLIVSTLSAYEKYDFLFSEYKCHKGKKNFLE